MKMIRQLSRPQQKKRKAAALVEYALLVAGVALISAGAGSLLDAVKRAVANRLRSADSRPRSLEELQHFVDTRGNDVILTPPRSMRVEEPARQLDDLFRQLILDPPSARVAPVPPNGANGATVAETVRSEERG
jgi:hypothetical protein